MVSEKLKIKRTELQEAIAYRAKRSGQLRVLAAVSGIEERRLRKFCNDVMALSPIEKMILEGMR